MQILLYVVVLIGSGYSFWYAYYLIKNKNKIGALGIILIGVLIGVLSYWAKIE